MRKREEEPLNAQKKRRKLRPADVAALLVLLIVVVLAALSLEDYVYGRMLKFTAVQSGVLEEKIYAQAIVMRQEYLLTAPIAGTFHPSMGEGDRANVNAVVGYVYGATSVLGVTTSRAGIVSFAVDGLETLLYPYISLADIDVKMVFELAAQEPPERGGEEGVVQGGVVGKIIDNLASHYWMILYFPGRTDIEAVNSNLSFFLANGKALSGRVDGSSYLDDGRFFYVRISMTRDDILLQRVLNAYVIGEKYS
ncbi:MAG: hypothetical protein FWE85_06380, partial [Clostridiales bacterium]|nr:hypothetical protein [Clostridiales bacterium]